MTTLNTLPALPVGQSPRAIVKVAGIAVPGWIRWSVQENTFYQADTFRVQFAAQELPHETDVAWFSAQAEAFVEVFAGFPDDVKNFSETGLTSLIYGRVDDVDYDPVNATLTLTGRDLTAAFIDAKVTIQFQNMTSSQIASQLAISHGLSYSGPVTKTVAGTYYAYDRVSMTDQRSEWDILTWLAQQEGFNCYVKGKTLHFAPQPTDESVTAPIDKTALQAELDQITAAWDSQIDKSKALVASAKDSDADLASIAHILTAAALADEKKLIQNKVDEARQIESDADAKYRARSEQLKSQLDAPAQRSETSVAYELRWELDENGNPTANVMDLKVSRSLTVAKGITVVVKSWNAKQSKGFTAYYPSRGKGVQAGKASPFGNQQTYSLTRGGLDQAGALALAQRTHAQITQHEMKLWARLPADDVMTRTTMVRLTGTNSKFDQDYFVDTINRSMSVDDGYVMDVSAKNINPESVPIL
jgi:phage protein D